MVHVDTQRRPCTVRAGGEPNRHTLRAVAAGILIVALTAQPVLAIGNDTRRALRIPALIGTVAALVVALTIRQSNTVRLIALDGADPLVAKFTRRGMAEGGAVTVSAEARQFQGRWTAVDTGESLASYWLQTPSGPITAFGLAQTRTPSGVPILEGDGVNLLCVWAGSFSAGVVTCADNSGRRYVGTW